jgi:hypothetical protein
MIGRRTIAAALLAAPLVFPAPADAQDSLTLAKSYYAAAAYDDALAMLERLQRASPGALNTEVATYEVFCLVAIGRSTDARRTITDIVKADPLYQPASTATSPRVLALFEEVRRPLLPGIIREMYATARKLFEQKDLVRASAGFDTVVALLDETELPDPGIADLRTLSAGFSQLIRATVRGVRDGETPAVPAPEIPKTTAAPPAPMTAPAPETPPAAPPSPAAAIEQPAAPEPEKVYGPDDAGVVAPVAVSRPMPPWNPQMPVSPLGYSGTLNLELTPEGTVRSVALREPIFPAYDALLLQAAKGWTFKPATHNGAPVSFRLSLVIQLVGR